MSGATIARTSEPAGTRSLDEVKAEVLRRAGRINPFEQIRPEDAERIVGALTSLDRDHWAETWCAVGLDYEAQADAQAKAGAAGKALGELYFLASDYCRAGRYPCASTPGKKKAYEHSVRMFRKAAAHAEIPLQILRIPFRDTALVGYLTIPPGTARPPVVIHWGGVDGWKEDRQLQSAALHRAGLATLTVDMPGTGENPLLYRDPDAIKTYVAWLDHLRTRTDLDGMRVGVWGGSFGAYWAARLAYEEAGRLKGAVFHGGNVHHGFQRDWLVPAFTKGGATYLFGPASLLEARSRAMGTTTMEEFLDVAPSLSLKTLGLLDRPSAPILAVNGKLDDQAPIEDVYLLLEHGSPKAARVYPEGRHMGRTPGMPEREIWDMIAAWLRETLAS